jgi:hypothetical protein
VFDIPTWKKAIAFGDSESVWYSWSCNDNKYEYNFWIYLR